MAAFFHFQKPAKNAKFEVLVSALFAKPELAAVLCIGCAANAKFVGLECRFAECLPLLVFPLTCGGVQPLLFDIANGVRNLRQCRLAVTVSVKPRIPAVGRFHGRSCERRRCAHEERCGHHELLHRHSPIRLLHRRVAKSDTRDSPVVLKRPGPAVFASFALKSPWKSNRMAMLPTCFIEKSTPRANNCNIRSSMMPRSIGVCVMVTAGNVTGCQAWTFGDISRLTLKMRNYPTGKSLALLMAPLISCPAPFAKIFCFALEANQFTESCRPFP
jgi:hypothetical protein